ncbi:MAG: hypothetical protein QF535_13815 [Anaerolineales bacterium]|nr:hypothetical protein [Anaerolineales bacterium]
MGIIRMGSVFWNVQVTTTANPNKKYVKVSQTATPTACSFTKNFV